MKNSLKSKVWSLKAALALGFFGFFVPLCGQAQIVPTAVKGSAALTNSLVASAKPGTKLYTVQGYVNSSSTVYVQVFQTNAVPASTNTSVPTFSFPVAAGQYYSMDFGQYGADLDKITVCISTNAASLGIAATNAASIQAIIRQ